MNKIELIAYSLLDRKIIINDANTHYLLYPEYELAECKKYITALDVKDAINTAGYIEDHQEFESLSLLINYVMETIGRTLGIDLSPKPLEKTQLMELFQSMPTLFIDKAISLQLKSDIILSKSYTEVLLEAIEEPSIFDTLTSTAKEKYQALKNKLAKANNNKLSIFKSLEPNTLPQIEDFTRHYAMSA